MDLHGKIMNLSINRRWMLRTLADECLWAGHDHQVTLEAAYRRGHRDARHAAAELVSEEDKKIRALTTIMQLNPLRNDLDGYIHDLCEWGIGDRPNEPIKEDYGL